MEVLMDMVLPFAGGMLVGVVLARGVIGFWYDFKCVREGLARDGN